MAFELDMTEKTPQVLFDTDKGEFSFTGILMPEDAMRFFKPLFEYVEVYFKNPAATTTLTIDLEYFNTAASRLIFQFMKRFSDLSSDKTAVKIQWKYEEDDPDMEEAGEEFSLLFTNVEFEMITVKRPRVFEIMG